MSNIDINQLLPTIESGIASLASTTLKEYLAAAKADGQAIVDNMKSEFQQWATEAEEGYLSAEDLQFLVREEGDLTEMTALKLAGLAAVRIDEFKAGVVSIITGAIAGLIKV
jgi:hypothetical protein